jgi:putative cell wall-binding protein/plastocyanin
MRKLITLAALLTLFATPLLAHSGPNVTHAEEGSVGTVFLASTENYPDAMVASSAAAKVNAPILLTDQDELSDEVADTLHEMSPAEVIVLGGEAVISEDIEATLEQNYSVSRMWGVTRYGTAVEIAEYFWQEGSDSALLVENDFDDRRGNILGMAKSIARTNGEPIFLTPGSKIPAGVMNELQDLGVSEIGYIGSELSEEVSSQLEELGITVRDRIGGDNETEVEQAVKERLRTSINTSQQFVVVGASDFRHSLAGTTDPNSNSYLVGDDDEIDSVVTFVNDEGIEDVRVVGAPDMVEAIAAALRDGTNASVTVRGVEASAVARGSANVTSQEIATIAQEQRMAKQRWDERKESRQDRLEQRANRSLERVRDMARDMNASDHLWSEIEQAEAAVTAGQYELAYETARDALEELREREWDRIKDSPDRVRDRARGETADLRDSVDDLRELNEEFAAEMRENLTVEERLEIISEFREKRREAVQELVEEASERRGKLTERFREAERRVDGSVRADFEQECADEDAPGIGSATAEFSGDDGYVEVEGMVGLNTPNYRANARDGVDRDSRTVSIDLRYTDVTRDGDTGGIQCTGVSDYEVRKYVGAGNWTVKLTVTVDGNRTASASGEVMVMGDDEDEMGDDDESSPAPMVETEDQDVEDDGTVEVEGYLNEPGYVVIHRDDNGQPGSIVGTSGLLEGEFDADVAVGMNASGTYWAMLHYDDGDGEFSASADAPVTRLNRTVQQRFSVSADQDDDATENETADNVVTYTSDGFSPRIIEIEQGETVTWRSEGPDMWVGSNQHPTHTEYDGTSLRQHCGGGAEATFDSCEDVDTYSFTFNKTGEWGYHNHLLSSHSGTVVVEE